MRARDVGIVGVIGIIGIFGRVESGAAGVSEPLHPSLDGRVLCGYQGWFRTPDDPAQAGWRHYLRQRDGTWHPLTDYLPNVSEAAPEERGRLPLTCADGGVAEVVSSDNRNTVSRHFGWMRQYGIDGVFVQRFPTDMYRGNLTPAPFRASGDRVLGYCREAAAANGRSDSLMYDLSGLGSNAAEVVTADWRHLVADAVVRGTNDVAWQYHSGRPVIALWGVGFNDNRLTFMPVVFPGFSWRNLTGAGNGIARRDGSFLWSQFAAAQRAGAACAYVAMFDEVDEGTQIFKVNNAPPTGEGFTYLSYGSLPSDHYLWLTGEATRLFRARQLFPDATPKRQPRAQAE